MCFLLIDSTYIEIILLFFLLLTFISSRKHSLENMNYKHESYNALANSKLVKSIVKKLPPRMLFLMTMSLFTFFGGYWWSKTLDPISITISYWIWFTTMIFNLAMATVAFFKDLS